MSVGGPRRVDLGAIGAGEALELAATLAAARLVCFPTDTVYGVGGVLSPAVVEAVRTAKGREPSKPLQVVFPARELLLATVPLGRRLRDACRRLLPGPVTLLVPYPGDWSVPPPGEVRVERRRRFGRSETVVVPTLGVRVPRWPGDARLLQTLPYPLVASSANRSGERPATALAEVDAAVLEACDLALDAGPVAGLASSVVDLSTYEDDGRWRLLRPGPWDEAAIEELLTKKRDDLPAP
ncbi:MAG TPA: Sua5/YciO/YrdC/YwlC family protein [Thermoleophilia bacterium]|nr:Sua5/YciO/YrdC/YwlC family protein [Thermoleophilia bacterium]